MEISPQLIRQCKAEDRRSQKELYLQLLPYVRAVCRRYAYKQTDLKDILQEAFFLIFSKIDKYNSSKGAFHSWAVRIAINATINYNKRISISNEDEFQLQYHDNATEPEVYQRMSNEELLTLMKEMPKNYFDVFNLHVIDQYSHEEIAELLGISVALSRKRLSRARYWLRTAINKKAKGENRSVHSKSLNNG
jgi:RNA polymerase sigma-70 factor (ECF subfamily)